MRLWSLHPRYLDASGLTAVWREALLAQKVLQGATRGYRQHPQLRRFQAQPDPLAAMACYLQSVHTESVRRGYAFDGSKIALAGCGCQLSVTRGQLEYEWRHLLGKLARRSPKLHAALEPDVLPEPHPLFQVVPGAVEPWEIAAVRPA